MQDINNNSNLHVFVTEGIENDHEVPTSKPDAYYNGTAMKTIVGLCYMYHQDPTRSWYIVADDDTYINVPKFLQWLNKFENPGEYLYIVGSKCAGLCEGASFALSNAALKVLIKHLPCYSWKSSALMCGTEDAVHLTENSDALCGDSLISNCLKKINLFDANVKLSPCFKNQLLWDQDPPDKDFCTIHIKTSKGQKYNTMEEVDHYLFDFPPAFTPESYILRLV